MSVIRFEDLIAWQKSQDFAVGIYDEFRAVSDWDFRNQICRASVSISNNIAEGFERSSNAEFIRFLYYSMGSASEVKSMLYLAVRLGFLNEDKKKILLENITEIAKIITGLIKSLKLRM